MSKHNLTYAEGDRRFEWGPCWFRYYPMMI